MILTDLVGLIRCSTRKLPVRYGSAYASGPTTTYLLRRLWSRKIGTIQCHDRQRSKRLDWKGGILRRPANSEQLGYCITNGLLDVPRLVTREHSFWHGWAGYDFRGTSDCGNVCRARMLYGVKDPARAKALESERHRSVMASLRR